MSYQHFSLPLFVDENGIVKVGGELNTESLLEAYSLGIFPWPMRHYPLLWFCPDPRGVLFFQNLHIPKSLQKVMRRGEFRFTMNQAFEKVIAACAATQRPHQKGTWITPMMQKAYVQFHRDGYAHSVECWNQNNELVGGLYGVKVGGVFSAESMFFKEPNASKCCLIYLIEHLKQQKFTWIDIQMVTAVTESLGGEEIARATYLRLLEAENSRVASL